MWSRKLIGLPSWLNDCAMSAVSLADIICLPWHQQCFLWRLLRHRLRCNRYLMLSLSRVWPRSGSDINTWVILEGTLCSLCKYRGLRLWPIHFEWWNHHILNNSTAINTRILIIDRILNISNLVLMIHKLSVISWLLLHKNITVTFIEDLRVRIEH
jgi:hypothetical protein